VLQSALLPADKDADGVRLQVCEAALVILNLICTTGFKLLLQLHATETPRPFIRVD
jgi:hypothetical protein